MAAAATAHGLRPLGAAKTRPASTRSPWWERRACWPRGWSWAASWQVLPGARSAIWHPGQNAGAQRAAVCYERFAGGGCRQLWGRRPAWPSGPRRRCPLAPGQPPPQPAATPCAAQHTAGGQQVQEGPSRCGCKVSRPGRRRTPGSRCAGETGACPALLAPPVVKTRPPPDPPACVGPLGRCLSWRYNQGRDAILRYKWNAAMLAELFDGTPADSAAPLDRWAPPGEVTAAVALGIGAAGAAPLAPADATAEPASSGGGGKEGGEGDRAAGQPPPAAGAAAAAAAAAGGGARPEALPADVPGTLGQRLLARAVLRMGGVDSMRSMASMAAATEEVPEEVPRPCPSGSAWGRGPAPASWSILRGPAPEAAPVQLPAGFQHRGPAGVGRRRGLPLNRMPLRLASWRAPRALCGSKSRTK